MASAAESGYFPALDKCLDGSRLLLSWRTAFVGLTSPTAAERAEPTLERFLSDPETATRLGRAYNCFQARTPATNSSFETKTAAIHATPSSHAEYDIDQIKADALWLSENANIDEVSALRIAVVEWQWRLKAQLLETSAGEGGSSRSQPSDSSLFAPRSSILLGQPLAENGTSADFQSTEARRRRLFKTYLSDRRYLLKVSELVIRAGLLAEPSSDQPIESEQGRKTHHTDWIARTGKTILNARISGGGTSSRGQSFILECIEGLETRIAGLDQGSGFFQDDGERPDVESDWGSNLLVEMTHILQIILSIIESSDGILSAGIIVRWLSFASTYGFFDNFQPVSTYFLSLNTAYEEQQPFPTQQTLVPPLQSLVAIVSLAAIKLPLSLETIAEFTDSPVAPPSQEDEPFLFDPVAMETVTDMLTGAATECISTASPTVFAWGILLQALRETVLTRRDRQNRETIESLAEEDVSGTEEGDSSATESGSTWRSRRRSPPPDPSHQPDRFDQALDKIILMSDDEDPISYLAKSAVNGSRVFDIVSGLASRSYTPYSSEDHGQVGRSIRSILLGLVRSSLEMVEYLPEVVNAVLTITTGGETFWDFVDRPLKSIGLDPASIILLDDTVIGPKVLEVAFARFPYEQLPLLKLIRALGACGEFLDGSRNLFFTTLLQSMPTFTQALPIDFRSYETAREEENANQIVLSSDLRIFKPGKFETTSPMPSGGDEKALVAAGDINSGDGLTIPTGTIGRVIFEGDPLVVQWDYKYSGLKYLGRLLESNLRNSHLDLNSHEDENDKDTIAETVGVFSVLLTSTVKAGKTDETEYDTERLLAEASDGLDRNSDIISVIFDIFENELQSHQFQRDSSTSLDLLVNCLQFIFTLTSIMPGRVWPFLARSSLLEIDGRGGKIIAVIASSEIPSGNFPFLMGSIRLFEALVKDAVDHSVARRCASKGLKRFRSFDQLGTGVPDKIMAKVLLAYARPLMDVLESSGSWKFTVLEDGLDTSARILSTFNEILQCTYGIDDSAQLESKITSALAPAAEYLIDVFLSTSSNNLVTQSITKVLDDGLRTPLSTIFVGTMQLWTSRVRKALTFSRTLIFASNLLRLPTSHFERQLFETTAHLVRLYASHESYRLPTITLLDAVVQSAGSWKEDTPSLLGQIGSETAKTFLGVLSKLDKPLDDDELEIGIWNFLTSIVSNRQQWFAVYLLLGNAPRDSLRPSAKVPSGSNRTLLSLALGSFEKISEMPTKRALAILEFIALAEDHWSWAVSDLKKHPTFLKSLLSFIEGLKTNPRSNDMAQATSDCYKTRMAACIAEILAMYFHHSRQMGDISVAKDSLSRMRFYFENAVSVSGYNASLHANLRRNFEEKFPGCTLSNFKRTDLQRRQLGTGYFYDTELANAVLVYEKSWSGLRGPGLAEEVLRANVNLSIVQAQVSLLHGWKLLAIELSNTMPQDVGLQKILARTVNDCLIANTTTNLPENFFDNLIQVRSDFAFILMQRLAEARSKEPEVKGLLKSTWSAIRSSGTNFEIALAGGDAAQYRSLLKMLFLALRAHLDSDVAQNQATGLHSSAKLAPKSASPSEIMRMILEILDHILGRSFRDLASSIHDQPETSSPEDIALLTAILQASLQVPGIERSHSHLRNVVAESGTARVATTLFSWSDQLSISASSGPNSGDPIYGELAILFLLELSSVPLIAEQLAIGGILGHLSAANLMGYLRRGIHPIDRRSQRIYSIWTRGLLPLCLNLLSAIGPPISREISSFLNQFSAQLALCSRALNSKAIPSTEHPMAGSLTLAVVSEAHSLTLIDRILESFRTAGAGTGVLASEIPKLEGWDAAEVKENVDIWLQGRRLLRERIVPIGEREAELLKTNPTGGAAHGGCESRLEERIVVELNSIAGLMAD
ncbi:MAG: 60S ribosomal protein L5 [Chaenotheca gracillima]|nr:MAG: 60S ribosomal protein L5 [Chaenotheca gracillima]